MPAREAEQRQEILRLVRRCSAESDPERVLRILIEGAVALVDADDGGIARWDEQRGELRQVESFLPSADPGGRLDLERSASGRAVTGRAPVIVDDYQGRACLAVPLLQEGRVLGAISLGRFQPGRPFAEADAGAVELLAGIGASAMIGQERLRAGEALRASEQRFRQIAEVADDIIWVRDREGKAVYVNPQIARLGYTPEEVVGRPTIDFYAPEDKEAAWRRFRRAMADEEETVRRVIELVARDGSLVPFESNASTLRDPDGRPIGRVAVLRDISDQRNLQQEMRRARDLALQMSEAKSAFLANMSHEIRTPLNGVIGMAGLLLDTEQTAEQREYTEVIRASGETLLAVINDILDFSKLEADKIELESQPFDVRECLESALDLVAAQAAGRGLELACSVDASAPMAVVGDVGRVRQVLLNLLSNAVKFTERGEVVASVAAEPAGAAGSVRLHFAVRDTGIGIPPDRLEHVFEAFTQGDASTARRHGGTGLGLAIGRGLVELMGGSMWVESRQGEGSDFRFTIKAEVASGEAVGRPPEPLARMGGRRVLVVEDNATNRQILVRQIESWGMRPRATPRPTEALGWVAAGEPFDAAVLDARLAEMGGLALAAQIRQHRGSRDLPLVLMTALGQRPADADLERLGIAAVLSKPVKTSHLFDALVQILGPDRLVPPAPSPAGGADGPPLGERVPLRILLVEDNATNQRVTLGQLARLGYRADVAANGLEALDALERRSYDVALMDVQMPELDGLEATRRILARWPTGERPRIVAMTAHALQGDREECLRAGMDDYLAKPIRLTELADALTRAGSSRPAVAPAGAAAPAGAESPLDAELLGKLRDEVGDEEFPAILETFVAEVSAQLDALGSAVEAGDAALARRLAHSVKGNGSYLGAAELVARCAEIEKLARAGTLAPAPELLAAARVAYQRVAAALADVQGASR